MKDKNINIYTHDEFSNRRFAQCRTAHQAVVYDRALPTKFLHIGGQYSGLHSEALEFIRIFGVLSGFGLMEADRKHILT